MTTRSKSKTNKLGHDPLAWMDDGEQDNLYENNVTVEKTDVDVSSQAASQSESEKLEPAVSEAASTGEASVLNLPAYFGIAQVAEVRQGMLDMLGGAPEHVFINVDEIESIDTAAIQLLIAFVREVAGHGHKIEYRGHSEKVENIADLLNVRSELHLA